MCTYLTEKIAVDGSGKGAKGWFSVSEATVYVAHPVHAPYGHTVNIDMLNPALGPAASRARTHRRDRTGARRRDPPRTHQRPCRPRIQGSVTAPSQLESVPVDQFVTVTFHSVAHA